MAGILLGRSAAADRPAPLFWSRPPDRPGAKNELPDFAIRDGKWKLLLHSDGKTELYDLVDDPGEILEKSADNPQIVTTLLAKLASWQKDVGQEKLVRENASAPPPAAPWRACSSRLCVYPSPLLTP